MYYYVHVYYVLYYLLFIYLHVAAISVALLNESAVHVVLILDTHFLSIFLFFYLLFCITPIYVTLLFNFNIYTTYTMSADTHGICVQ